MVQINTQKGKRLKFGVSVAGVQPRDLKGALRMKIGEIEYGFPAVLENGSLVVNIPALDTVIDNLVEGQRIEAKLEVVAQDTYIIPWSDTVRIEKPITVEAQIAEEEDLKGKRDKIREDYEQRFNKVIEDEDIEQPKSKPKKQIKETHHNEPKKKSKSKLAKMMGS